MKRNLCLKSCYVSRNCVKCCCKTSAKVVRRSKFTVHVGKDFCNVQFGGRDVLQFCKGSLGFC